MVTETNAGFAVDLDLGGDDEDDDDGGGGSTSFAGGVTPPSGEATLYARNYTGANISMEGSITYSTG